MIHLAQCFMTAVVVVLLLPARTALSSAPHRS